MLNFENFISYCSEDNEQLANDIKTWCADWIDLPNRKWILTVQEIKWLNDNLTKETQLEVFGMIVDDANNYIILGTKCISK